MSTDTSPSHKVYLPYRTYFRTSTPLFSGGPLFPFTSNQHLLLKPLHPLPLTGLTVLLFKLKINQSSPEDYSKLRSLRISFTLIFRYSFSDPWWWYSPGLLGLKLF